MNRNRLFVLGIVIFLGGLFAATNFGALYLLGVRWAPAADGGFWETATRTESVGESKDFDSEFSSAAVVDMKQLDTEIESLESEIQARQTQIEREQVVKMLNESRINDYERKIYFDLLNAQADARTRQIELRMRRLRALVDQGSES